ncbi:19739_t:CDS:2, partial [Funneliformis geosporum]
QERDNNGKFTKKPKLTDESDEWRNEDDNNTHLEQKKRRSYLTGKTKKLTYFDKYEPSGSFTNAAKGTIRISTFMNKDKLTPDDFVEIELKEQQKILTVTEYNKNRAIYEYLKRLDKNGKGKGKANDEDIAEKCHVWIRSQGGITTSLKFKEFVEQELLINSGITKKKTISKITATRWLNVLGYFFQSQEQ